MLRYAAHLSIAFKEVPFYERFQRAVDLGFSAVEFMSPFDYDVDLVVQAARDAGVQVVQYNFFNGDLALSISPLSPAAPSPSWTGRRRWPAWSTTASGRLRTWVRSGCL